MARPNSKPIAAALALLSLTSAGAAFTQDDATPTPPANICEDDPLYSQFDFWVGEWTVTTPAGDIAGENTISRLHGGCLLLEEWTGAGGSTGTSMNYVDPDTGLWRQVWVSQGVVIDYYGGLDGSGAMVLEGEVFYPDAQRSAPFRGTWTPLDNGDVRQHFQEYDAESGDWSDWFIGVYTPKE